MTGVAQDGCDVPAAYDACIADGERLFTQAKEMRAAMRGELAAAAGELMESLDRYVRSLKSRRRSFVAVMRHQ